MVKTERQYFISFSWNKDGETGSGDTIQQLDEDEEYFNIDNIKKEIKNHFGVDEVTIFFFKELKGFENIPFKEGGS